MPAKRVHRSEETTAALLARCGLGDRGAFKALYDAQSRRLYGVALRITRNPANASDAVHDAMLQVWRSAARFTPERGSAETWLLSLVRYRALDIARRVGREITGTELPEAADLEPGALDRMVMNAEGRALRECLEEVEPSRRELVVLSFINGLTQSEIAERLDQPLGTVKSTIRRVLLTLRACISRVLGSAG